MQNKLKSRLDITFILTLERVWHFLMINGKLFDRVAAPFPKHLLLYVRDCILGTVISGSDSDLHYAISRK